MSRQNWDLVGLTEPTWGLNAYGARTMILAPPKVKVSLQEAGTIVYLAPQEWQEEPILWIRPGWLIENCGWELKKDHTGLLDDLLKLAEADIKPETIVKFAKKWGPLWLCRNPKHSDCFWTPDKAHQRGLGPLPGGNCLWGPKEETAEFVRNALAVTAALNAAAESKLNRRIPAPLWEFLGAEDPRRCADFTIEEQRILLAYFIDDQMSRLGNTTLRISWYEEKPTLGFHTGLGFLAAAWTQVAQSLCGVHGMYQCSGCGVFYVRTKRKPREGEGNYCDECSEGYLASKRLEKQRKRTKKLEKRIGP